MQNTYTNLLAANSQCVRPRPAPTATIHTGFGNISAPYIGTNPINYPFGRIPPQHGFSYPNVRLPVTIFQPVQSYANANISHHMMNNIQRNAQMAMAPSMVNMMMPGTDVSNAPVVMNTNNSTMQATASTVPHMMIQQPQVSVPPGGFTSHPEGNGTIPIPPNQSHMMTHTREASPRIDVHGPMSIHQQMPNMMIPPTDPSPAPSLMNNTMNPNVPVATGNEYDAGNQLSWQSLLTLPGDPMYEFNTNAAGDSQIPVAADTLENKENNDPYNRSQGTIDITDSSIPPLVDGQNDHDLSPICTNAVFEEVCKLPVAVENLKVRKTLMQSSIDIESPKRNKSRNYVARNRCKDNSKRSASGKSAKKGTVSRTATTSSVGEDADCRSQSPPRSPILSLSPVWSPSHKDKKKMTRSPVKTTATKSSTLGRRQSSNSSKRAITSTLFDMFFDKSVSNLYVFAEIALIKEDKERMKELDDVIETEQVIWHIDAMIREQCFVPFADEESKSQGKAAKKNKLHTETDCSIGALYSYCF